jgi:hypothetical protein
MKMQAALAAQAGDKKRVDRLQYQIAQAMHQVMEREKRARLPKHRTSAGLAWDKANRGINKEEMRDVQREISKESNRELIDGFARAIRENIRGGMSTGQLDAALGGYIQHRNNMRPDVR